MDPSRVPLATYRLQFNADFTFADATDLVPYLADLGISHCYASPYLKARTGSQHGYDIVDHNALNPEIGDREGLAIFTGALHDRSMGQILDVVPNHMGVGGDDNVWWLDVLENGASSPYAVYFDIDWQPVKEQLREKILVPVLGDHYGKVLQDGELHVVFNSERGEFSIRYFEHRFPIDPRTYPSILEQGQERLEEELGRDHPVLLSLRSLMTAFGHLPERNELTEEKMDERRRDKEIHKRHLAELCDDSPIILDFIRTSVRRINGQKGTPESFDALDVLLSQQAYRLAYWQVASDEINYRRFFDINDLAGLRMEQSGVFKKTHELVLELIGQGQLQGLRIDHIDGLYDPKSYCERLVAEIRDKRPESSEEELPCYLVVEKILAAYEHLPEEWPVDGTTGYDFACLVNGLFVDPESEQELTRLYARFSGRRISYDDLLYERKHLTIEVQLSSELTVLTSLLNSIAQTDRHTRDFTLNGCRSALTVLTACFPVYRTYITAGQVSDEDRRYVEWAVAQAKKRSPAGDISIFDFIRDLLLKGPLSDDPVRRRQAVRFAMKFQQYTAPVMAKAAEDTVFYIYNRLISLNEVGGDPRRFGHSVAAFHRGNQERLRYWPHGMLSTSTHDSKRSEDVRARINVISEVSDDWNKHVSRWSRVNRNKKVEVDGFPAPDRNDEYLLYQTLFGSWPLEEMDERDLETYRERIKAYMLKAVKEAKMHTSWINPNTAYEAAVCQMIDTVLSPGANPFLADFVPFQRRLVRYGLLNSLSQTLLKLTAPGIPDLYQGSELWEFALVDPDNRRPVDYRRRMEFLAWLKREFESDRPRSELCRELERDLEDGRSKLYLIWRTLTLRRRYPHLFKYGDYQPLSAEGEWADCFCAFTRDYNGRTAVSVTAQRFVRLLKEGPSGFVLPGTTPVAIPCGRCRAFENIFTGERFPCKGEVLNIPVEHLFGGFPAVLLISC